MEDGKGESYFMSVTMCLNQYSTTSKNQGFPHRTGYAWFCKCSLGTEKHEHLHLASNQRVEGHRISFIMS